MAIAQCTNTLTFYVSPSAQHPPNQPLTSLQLLQVRRCHITSPGTPSPLPLTWLSPQPALRGVLSTFAGRCALFSPFPDFPFR